MTQHDADAELCILWMLLYRPAASCSIYPVHAHQLLHTIVAMILGMSPRTWAGKGNIHQTLERNHRKWV